MTFVKGTTLILLALFIDGLQAGISMLIALIAAVPGTALGAAGGALAGSWLCGWMGSTASAICGTVGGFVLGFAGTWLDPALAVVSEPIGIAIGFAINICLSVTLGAFLLMVMFVFLRKIYVTNLFFGLGELIPGINNIPFWTAFVVISLVKKSKEDGSALGAVAAAALSPGSAFGKAAGGIMAMKETTMNVADATGAFSSPLMPQPLRAYKERQDDIGDPLNQESIDQNLAPGRRAAAQATRQIFNDIRPAKTAAAVLLAVALAISGAHAAYAQAVDPLRFITSPEVPGPGDQVTIEAQGVGAFLGDATVTWQQDGKTVLTGVGERRFTFTAGPLGSITRIHVIIDSASNGVSERDFTVSPSVVHLLWEADTAVPPLYRGKALYTAGSTFRVMALPQVVANGATVSYNNLSFQWKLNGDAVVGQSGKGRSSASFQGSQLRAGETVSVDVYLNSFLVGRASISVPAIDPELLIYQKDPLRGVLYDQALPPSVSLLDQEVTLQAAPYYFSKDSVSSGAAAYAWTINGAATTGPDSARGILTLRQAGSGAGQALLGVSLQNNDPSKFVQAAQAALRIVFNAQGNADASSFGL
ncbi:MAG TPA: hypothetical protein VHD37_02020 [Candidatus Paceibacterota bacterium]|nr:hypothetical protein [Candidatus Paceibacterota bacterium]